MQGFAFEIEKIFPGGGTPPPGPTPTRPRVHRLRSWALIRKFSQPPQLLFDNSNTGAKNVTLGVRQYQNLVTSSNN